MTEVKIYCDHCGKVLDEMHDYCDTEIECYSYMKADLCKKCLLELDSIIQKFLKKGGEG
jgi:hypothetical protein